jgi:hypothetical protein
MKKESRLQTREEGTIMHKNNGDSFDIRNDNLPLAQWLQQILATSPQHAKAELSAITENGGQFGDEYHIEFYQQLPDFVMALLTNNTQENTIRFAPLVFHVIGCPVCHTAYLEIYDAMHAARAVDEAYTSVDQWPQSIATTSTRMLVYMCRLFINQAAEVLSNARRNRMNNDALARSLLQQAIYLSSHLMQSTLRQRALQDLVEVATLFDVATTPASHSYTPLLSIGSGSRHGKIRRRAETLGRTAGQAVIYLQSSLSEIEGTITQNQEILELHLEDLRQEVRGQFLTISIPLGSLLEPVRWIGGNPHAILSQFPVDEVGSLTTPLGSTDLQLSDPEDHNLLEAMFKKIDVRPSD